MTNLETSEAALPWLRVVLVQPEQPRNVGAVVRAAANFGAESVWLVAAADWTDEAERAARIASSGGWDILGGLHLVSSLAEATAECQLIAGTSARQRENAGDVLSPAEFFDLQRREPTTTRVAMVLGPESQGLSSAELAKCHVRLRIPSAPAFSSLNLGHAVAVLLYEASRSVDTTPPTTVPIDIAPAHDQERWLNRIAEQISGTDGPEPREIAQLRRLLARSSPTPGDIALLHNLLKRLTQP